MPRNNNNEIGVSRVNVASVPRYRSLNKNIPVAVRILIRTQYRNIVGVYFVRKKNTKNVGTYTSIRLILFIKTITVCCVRCFVVRTGHVASCKYGVAADRVLRFRLFRITTYIIIKRRPWEIVGRGEITTKRVVVA